MTDDKPKSLVARLREASTGYDEWRVQDPKDGSYCIAYSRLEHFSPERQAREWLADHKARFPGGRYANYEVAKVRVKTQTDSLLEEAADEIERLRADAERYRLLRQDFSPMGLNIDGNHSWAYRRNFSLIGPNLDEAIDKARIA